MASIDSKLIHFSRGKKTNLGKVKNMAIGLPSFIDEFRIPLQTPETIGEYLKLPDHEQSRLKKLNGFFFRTQVTGGRRVKGAAKPSDIVTLDFDHASHEFIDQITKGLVLRGIKFFVHSTRRHTEDNPRIRMVVFLKKPVDNDIYGAVSRVLAFLVDPDMDMIDLVSFRTEQMMYMPTISRDSEYFFHESNGTRLLDWEDMLSTFSEENGDWTDLDNLPKVPGETLRHVADKAENPEEKEGPVGDFCRTWNVIEAIEHFELPYTPVDEFSTKPRYTYTGGTTRNGAIVEDDGLFLTSYHGSDPVGGRTVNAWDLVTAHLFGDLDLQEDPDTPMGKRASWKAMLERVNDEPAYRKSIMQSQYDMKAIFDDLDDESLGITHVEEGSEDDAAAATPSSAGTTSDESTSSTTLLDDLGPLDKDALDLLGETSQLDDEAADLLGLLPKSRAAATAIVRVLPAVDPNWFNSLEWEGTQILNSLPNVMLILQNDKRIRGCIEWNEFLQQVVTRKALKTKLDTVPKVDIKDPINGDRWTDSMTTYVRAILETPNGKGKVGYGMRVTDRDLNGAIDATARRWPFHPIKDAIEFTVWDGVKRAETLFIDFLGCPDTAYNRAVCRVWLLGAMTRIYEPGHKFDFVPILEGPQGIRKSTFIETLALSFFGNLTANFNDDKKLIEQILGKWVIEIPELGNMGRSAVEDCKAFISMKSTVVRMSFGRRAEEFKRQCVFMGSTNKKEYLTDTTGNRRFWPIKVLVSQIDTVGLANIIGQVWAEVLVMYHDARKAQPYGDLPLYLSGAEEQEQALQQQTDRQQDSDANVWSGKLEEYLNTPYRATPDSKTWLFRDRTCYPELFEKALEDSKNSRFKTEYDLMTQAMGMIGWEKIGAKHCPGYGRQKAFERKRPLSVFDQNRLIEQHLRVDRFDLPDPEDPDDDDGETLL